MIENERTFLVKRLPEDLKSKRREKIRQGYLSEGLYPLRIRQKGNKYELTKKEPKTPGDFSRHEETTIYPKKEEFEKLWPLTVKSLEKTRYFYPLVKTSEPSKGGLTAEIDVFEKKLKGLVFVEVEFPSKKAMESFIPPDWFGRDVTQEEWSVNAYLAGKSFEEIKRFLD